MAQLIAAIAIELEAQSSRLAVFCVVADDFDDALEAAEESYAFVMQADQQIVMREFFAAIIQHNTHRCGLFRIAAAGGNESGGSVMPQQLIQGFAGRPIGRAEYHAYSIL